jgi:hypothetical protein
MAPAARTEPTVGWSGSSLLVYGGNIGGGTYTSRIYTYDVTANAWSQGKDGPSARYGAFGTWDGTYLSAWSGASPLQANGKIYEPTADKWTAMATTGQPASRWAPNRQTGWSARIKPGVTLFVGGMGATTTAFFTDGGIYNSTTNSWSAVAAWPSAYSHLYGVGVWSGSELVVWGGRTGTAAALTTVGERYRP